MLAVTALTHHHTALSPWQIGYKGGFADRHYFPELDFDVPEDWTDFLAGHRAGQIDLREIHPPYRKRQYPKPKPQEIQEHVLALLSGAPRTTAELRSVIRRRPEVLNSVLSELRKAGAIYTQMDSDGRYMNYAREPRP